jgi:hypothetical protein
MATSTSPLNDRRWSAHDDAADLRPPGTDYGWFSNLLDTLKPMVVTTKRGNHRN